MNHGVAPDAWRDLSRPRIHTVYSSRGNWAMALVTHLINIRNIQQPGVLRTMRCMTAKATLCLHRSVFEYERAARLRMAFAADHVLIGR